MGATFWYATQGRLGDVCSIRRRFIISLRALVVVLGTIVSSARGQAIIELVPDQPPPYTVDQRLTVDFWITNQSDTDKNGIPDEVDNGSLCVSGEGFFDYTPHRVNREAELLAMDLSYELRAPDAEYDRILRDLQFIRANYPVLDASVDDLDFVPDALIIRLNDTGSHTAYDAMNIYYQVIEDRLTSPTMNKHRLTFCDNLNTRLLRSEYETLASLVVYAIPILIIGQEVEITISLLPKGYRYTIVHGFGDCPSGCICKRTWVIDVHDDGTVSLVSYNETGSLSGCMFEQTVCCLPNDACQTMSIGSCLDQDGTPQEFGTVCSVCYEPPVPALSIWRIALTSLLTLTMGAVILGRSAASPT